MAKLETVVGKGVPTSKFGAPAKQQVGKGTLSEASAAKIRAKATRMLGAK